MKTFEKIAVYWDHLKQLLHFILNYMHCSDVYVCGWILLDDFPHVSSAKKT